ncbi:MAG TPA: outer membrane protein assembly factor BamE [Gammaproteobacteria bacterium]|nr:outer membrane protein assembly factor BamE [Gammaproteobacteria bacterium]
MKKIISLTMVFLILILPGCSLFRVHKFDIEQGNILSQENIARLRIGMTETEVKSIMGNPVLINVFTPDRLNYVYSFQKGHEKITVKRVILIFQSGKLREIMTSN